MSAETLRRYRMFTLTEYEAEERWLREMANQGWMLQRVILPVTYIFEKIEPADIVFKLDFQDTKKQPDDTYMQMAEDYGWTYLTSVNYYRYLYKTASADEQDNEIYTDNESKLDMLKRIVRMRLLPVLVIYLCCVIPNFFRSLNGDFQSAAMEGFWYVMIVIYTLMFARMASGYWKLIRKYSSENS